MIHILELIKFSIPALIGWHAMMDSSVVAAGNGYNNE